MVPIVQIVQLKTAATAQTKSSKKLSVSAQWPEDVRDRVLGCWLVGFLFDDLCFHRNA
jgi:hypothetical protein